MSADGNLTGVGDRKASAKRAEARGLEDLQSSFVADEKTRVSLQRDHRFSDEVPCVRVVDDDTAVRESLCELVRAMGLRVECFSSALDFLASEMFTDPGCIVLDIRLPGMSGIELQSRLIEAAIDLPIIAITGHGTVSTCRQAMKQGAVDFLEKPYRPGDLRQAIRSALELHFQRRLQEKRDTTIRERIRTLSKSEQDVLRAMLAGKQNKEIAAALDISLRTVQIRRGRIMETLEVETRVELVKLVTSIDDPWPS